MQVIFHKSFRKKFRKLPAGSQAAFERRLLLFLNDPFAAELNNHGLSGTLEDFRSINVTGDLRALYFLADADTAVFTEIGTHHELYGS